jgi:uncharacterized beta-barrel protein YwiB (DUF1934 family)
MPVVFDGVDGGNILNKKEVSIKLVSRQNDGQTNDETELYSRGTYEIRDNCFVISYEESEATGFEGSVTTLEICQGKVVMYRTGEVSSNLIIEMGTKHHCVYGTPYGSFTVGVNANQVKYKLDENGGEVYFHYVIDVNSSYLGDFEISIEVK